MNPIKQKKFKLIGIKKLLVPVKDMDLMGTGGPTRALFGFLPGTAAQKSGQELADFLKRVQRQRAEKGGANVREERFDAEGSAVVMCQHQEGPHVAFSSGQ